MTHILIIEDNKDLAYGLRTMLEIEGHKVECSINGYDGIERVKLGRPDLIILDLMMPELNGYEVLRMLREQGIETPVLILTARGEEADKVLGFRLGADDYVTKPFGRLELLARVQALLRRAAAGTRGNGSAIERFGDVEVNTAARTVTRGGEQVALTPKEFDLLVALIRRRGAVATRLELLKAVWGHRAEVMTRTVDIHIAELRRKLEENPSEPRHILTVWKAGYRLQP